MRGLGAHSPHQAGSFPPPPNVEEPFIFQIMSGEKFPIWKRGRDFHVSGLKRGTFIKRRIFLPSKSAISGPQPRLTPLKQILPLARVEMSSGGKARDYCDRRPSVREIEAATSVIRKIPLRLRRNASQSHFLSRTKTPRLSRWATLICAHYGLSFTTGRKPVSDWNRPVRTRMPGGVGPVAD